MTYFPHMSHAQLFNKIMCKYLCMFVLDDDSELIELFPNCLRGRTLGLLSTN